MNPKARAYLNRIKSQALADGSVENLSRWIETNTAHPRDSRKPWSFDQHEYQRDILNCPARDLVVKKVSQVGMSEIMARMVLALASVQKNSSTILTLPTQTFATTFARTRLSPVIDDSPVLKSELSRDVDSASLKQIGSSFVYILGTFGEKQAISIPSQSVFHDEVDFSNQAVLANFASRLGHEMEGDNKLRRQFSTPTIPKYGISRLYDDSSQAMYAVKHDKCGKWVVPRFINDVVLPGFKDSLWTFSKEDLQDPRVKVEQAWLKCPECHREITLNNLADPEKRKWVHAFPDVEKKGFWVQSIDVPTINPPPRTLSQVSEYETTRDWLNFKVGEAYRDSDNSFIEDIVDSHKGPWIRPREGAANGCVFGMDIGKTSHLLIGKKKGREISVIHAERIRQTGQDALRETIRNRLKEYGIVKGVLDAAPDFTTAMALIEEGFSEQIWACQYVRKAPKSLTSYSLDPVDQIVKAHRTRSLNEAARMHNSGRVIWCNSPESVTIKQHLGNLKRLTRGNADGEDTEYWVKVDSEDHYIHALNYLCIAADMAFGDGSAATRILVPGVSTFQFDRNEQTVAL